MVDDALQTAWLRLTARPDIDPREGRVRGWLYTVAVREVYALARKRARLQPLADEDAAAVGMDRTEDVDEHLDRVAAFAQLKSAERTALLLRAAGRSYADIQELTHASHTQVNRRLAEGRARLRDRDAS